MAFIRKGSARCAFLCFRCFFKKVASSRAAAVLGGICATNSSLLQLRLSGFPSFLFLGLCRTPRKAPAAETPAAGGDVDAMMTADPPAAEGAADDDDDEYEYDYYMAVDSATLGGEVSPAPSSAFCFPPSLSRPSSSRHHYHLHPPRYIDDWSISASRLAPEPRLLLRPSGTPSPRAFIFSVENAVCTESYRRQILVTGSSGHSQHL